MDLFEPTVGATPYPGLRPFETNEADIFFGRERQTDRLLEKLQALRFLAIVGPSGCGKSSLLNAGLIPALHTGFMADAGAAWFVARFRPGDRPISALADAVLSSRLIASERALLPEAQSLVEMALRRGPLGLLELATESGLEQRGNLLVVVDQFEELFRMALQVDANEAEAFIALLLRSAAQRNARVYVCITMRSDFLGDAAAFYGLPEAINEGLYLTPRLEREECAQAIAGPARVFGGELEVALVNRLLNDFGPDPDQLPLLQHALMRMWTGHAANEPGFHRAPVLTVADYAAIGGLSQALSNHADEAYAELSTGDQALAEVMFRRLSDARSAKRDARAPARVSEIAALAKAEASDVVRVADVFRRADRCFLSPRQPAPLDADQVLDVSHESLLRQWRKLAGWVEKESESAFFYQRVKETATAWRLSQAALWRAPDLDRALKWREESHPSEAWAVRYGSAEDFSTVMAFLEASSAARQQELTRSEAERVRQLRHARRIAVVSACTALSLALGILAYVFLYVYEYRADFKSYSKVRGAPMGIGPLTPEQVAHRTSSIRLVKAGYLGLVQRMEVVDADGKLTSRHGIGTYLRNSEDMGSVRSPAYWEFGYDSHDRVASETAFGKQGDLIYGFAYVPSSKDSVETRSGYFLGPDGLPDSEIGMSAGVAIEYDSKGFEHKLTYRGPGGDPVAARDKAFGKLFEYDDMGRLTMETSLTRDGAPMNDSNGNASVRATYDARSNPVHNVALDADGNPTQVVDGWVHVRDRFDDWGNAVETSYFDKDDKPINTKNGYHRETYTNDPRGNPIHIEYFDSTGGRVSNRSGCHQAHFEVDLDNRVVRSQCLDQTGKPVLDAEGCASQIYAYGADDKDDVTSWGCLDEKGAPAAKAGGSSRTVDSYSGRNRIGRVYYGVDDRPVLNDSGFAGWHASYDKRNRLTRMTYVGIDDKPVLIKGGFATELMNYDEHGQLLQKRYLDKNDNPVIQEKGYAGYRAQFDSRGYRTEVAYFGKANEHAISVNGYAGWRSDFNDLGNETAVHYFGLKGEPAVTREDGVAGWHSEFDTWGNEIRRQFVGPDERPITCLGGYSSRRTQFDARGHVMEERFFNVDGQPTLRSWDGKTPTPGEGYARAMYDIDSQGHQLEVAYFGVYDEPVKNRDGFSRAKNEYNARGLETSSRYFGIDGRPARHRLGYHLVQRSYDTKGEPVEFKYFDVDGTTPVVIKEGYSRLEKEYGPTGELVRQSAFGPDGPTLFAGGFHSSVREYDVWRRLTQERYLGLQGEPVDVRGVHRTSYLYDERGNCIENRHFDLTGQPTKEPDTGCVVLRRSYDLSGNIRTEECLDTSAQLAPNQLRVTRAEMTYDAGKRILSLDTFDAKGNPVASADGYAREMYEYDALGRRIWIRRYGPDGLPIASKSDHVASEHRVFDNLGNLVESRAFGTKGEPILNAQRYHLQTQRFNARHQLLEMATYDTKEGLIVNTNGFARATREYDDRGNLVEVAAFGADGKLSIGHHGYARLTNKYNEKGDVEEEAYFDRNNKPVALGGVARLTYAYDADGNQVEVCYFGADGKPRTPVARTVRKFDAAHRPVEERHLSADGKPVLLGGFIGQHLTQYKYDTFGNKIVTDARAMASAAGQKMVRYASVRSVVIPAEGR